MIKPHKYRCETCKYFGNPPPNLRYWYGYCDLIDNKQNSRDLTEEEIKIHNLMGCASHSECVEDFVSLAGKMEEVIRKDEREKLLNKLRIKIATSQQCNNCEYSNKCNGVDKTRMLCIVDSVLTELRQEGKVEK